MLTVIGSASPSWVDPSQDSLPKQTANRFTHPYQPLLQIGLPPSEYKLTEYEKEPTEKSVETPDPSSYDRFFSSIRECASVKKSWPRKGILLALNCVLYMLFKHYDIEVEREGDQSEKKTNCWVLIYPITPPTQTKQN